MSHAETESLFRPRRLIQRQYREVGKRLAPWFQKLSTHLKYILVCEPGHERVYDPYEIEGDDLREINFDSNTPIRVVSKGEGRFEIHIYGNQINFNRISLRRLANPMQVRLDRALIDLEDLEKALLEGNAQSWEFSVSGWPSYEDCCGLLFPVNAPIAQVQLETIADSETVVGGNGVVTFRLERRGIQVLVLEIGSDLGPYERWGLLFVYWHGNFPPPLPIPNPGR